VETTPVSLPRSLLLALLAAHPAAAQEG